MIKLSDICMEIAAVVNALAEGRLAYKADNQMAAMKYHPADILNSIFCDVCNDTYFGLPVSTEELKKMLENLKKFKTVFCIKEISDAISHLSKYIHQREADTHACEGKEDLATANKQPSELHGNPETKTLHGPSCKYFNAKGSTEKFASMDQAVKKGYKLCSICQGK